MKALQQLLTTFFAITLNAKCVAQSSSENERLTEYHETGNSWPPRPDEYTPNTPGWQKLNRRRFEQFKGVGGDDDEVYNMYMVCFTLFIFAMFFGCTMYAHGTPSNIKCFLTLPSLHHQRN